ncbi:MAG: YjfB family protein [Velocimicrobium sp.]
MDIAALSISMSQQNIMSQVSIAVLDKSLSTVSSQGDSMTKMMEQSVDPTLGQSIDISV